LSNFKFHRERVVHNEQFTASLRDPYWDWAVTATFYTALHYVEAYLAKKTPPIHSQVHPDRDDNIRRDGVLKQVWSNYRDLKNQSVNARYQPHIPFTQTDINDAQKHLESIKRVIAPLL
jgi:hypothetical protein